MGGTLSQCRCTEQHTPTGYVCETCGGMEFRERPAAPIAGVSREPISAEQWLASRYDRYGKPLSITGDIQLSAQELIRMLEEFANDV